MNPQKLISAALFLLYVSLSAQEWLTIFIHGTIGLRPAFAFDTLLHVLKDNLDASPYRQAVDSIRDDCFFYQNQPIQERGLLKIPTTAERSCLGAPLFANLFDEINRQVVGDDEHNSYYTFGWSGLISHRVRYNEARILYVQLQQELERLRYLGINPKIRIIAYSHGGNLALNLGAIQQQDYPGDALTIDELYLIGTPVQRETDHLVCAPLFTKIYNIYSRSDNIQRLDCFSFRRFFSKRHFATNKRYAVPEKLTQIEIKLNSPLLGKDRRCPWTHCHQHNHGNRSPGHLELWFFGWAVDRKSFYRENFPLSPLPFALFARALVETVKQAVGYRQVIAEWRVLEGNIHIRQRHVWKKIVVPFITKEHLAMFKDKALQCKPAHFTAEIYRAHVKNIINLTHHRKSHSRCVRTKSLCGS